MDHAVLIVGAGPVGLLAALWLTKLGVPVRIVDRAPHGSVHSKALGVHANSLELLQRVGVADAFVRNGRPMRRLKMMSYDGDTIAEAGLDGIDSPYDYVLMCEQSVSERILREALRDAGVEVEWNVALDGLQPSEHVCVASFVGAASSTHQWVIGCDGGPSTVRELTGISFDGEKYGTWFVLADVAVDWDEAPGETRGFLGRDGIVVAFPLPAQGRYRIVATMPDAPADKRPELSDALFEELMHSRCAVPATLSDYHWQSAFQVRRRLASTYRVGRVFVAGDAAHTHSPIGGQGMNTGFADVSNLCWKIASVIKGVAPQSLLDTYESERRPVAKSTLFATQLATEVAGTRSPVVEMLRNQIMAMGSSLEPVRERVVRRASMTEFAYAGPQFGAAPISAAQTELRTHPHTEAPSVAQRFEFGSGPRPGQRAPEVLVAPHTHLLGAAPPSHVLLLFDGLAATTAGYDNFAQGCERIAQLFPWIRPIVVLPDGSPTGFDETAIDIVRDDNFAAHERYGSSSESGYLIRPDNYVMWRAQPMDFDALIAFVGQQGFATT